MVCTVYYPVMHAGERSPEGAFFAKHRTAVRVVAAPGRRQTGKEVRPKRRPGGSWCRAAGGER